MRFTTKYNLFQCIVKDQPYQAAVGRPHRTRSLEGMTKQDAARDLSVPESWLVGGETAIWRDFLTAKRGKNKNSQMPRSSRSSHVEVSTFDSLGGFSGFKMDILGGGRKHEMLTESGQVHYALIWLACSLAPGACREAK